MSARVADPANVFGCAIRMCGVLRRYRPGFTLHVRGEWVVWVSVWGVMGAALAWWWWEGGARAAVGVWNACD